MVRKGLGVAACLVVLAGCARPEALTVSGTQETPTRLAPEVPLPIDLSPYADAPCTLLKSELAVTRDLAAGKADGTTCTWPAKTPQQPEMTATVDVKSDGLEGLYRRRSQLPYFEPTDIAGYPAVRTDNELSVPNQGRCTVSVGLADKGLLIVTSAIADSKTLNYPVPCPDTDLFATAIVSDITKN
jgi:Protein of unknown function (DUF3558)